MTSDAPPPKDAGAGTCSATGAGQMEFRKPEPGMEQVLEEFFAGLERSGTSRWFHPHPFDGAAARERCAYRGADAYCIAIAGGRVLGYGLLRGWDEGYQVPSLGIAVADAARGTGLGRALMLYLHAEAKRRGAPRIRLKVYPDNQRAVTLYRSLGYVFQSTSEDGQLIGYKELGI